MGKQSRRKNKRRSGGKSQHRPTGLADDPASAAAAGGAAAASPEAESPSAKIIGKIRHGDPRVRHASLVALSRTIYDCSSLESAASKKNAGGNNSQSSSAAEASDPLLLRALSERMLDPDVPCATTAAGCLSNYVSFYLGANNGEGDDGGGSDVDVASDVMVPILLQRLLGSLGSISSLGSKMESARDKAAKKKEANKGKGKGGSTSDGVDKIKRSMLEQWSLLSLSLVTLAGLVENCPAVLQRVGANAFPLLMNVFHTASISITCIRENTSSDNNVAAELEPILDSATHAARGLHSLLDDNRALIASLPAGTSAAAAAMDGPGGHSLTSAVSILANVINNVDLPHMTRLHASGSILSLRRVIVLERDNSAMTAEEEPLVTALQTCTNEVILPLLSKLFDPNGDDARPSHDPRLLLDQIRSLSQQLAEIRQYANMESQIVSQVNARKEPAREIARRQKQMKEKKKQEKAEAVLGVQAMNEDEEKSDPQEAAASASAGAAMVVEEEDSTAQDGETNKQAEDDLKDQLDGAVSRWRDLVGSHKLALELVANLCSSDNGDEEEESVMDGDTYGDDDEHMWNSDDEAKLMAEANASAAAGPGGGNASPFQQATYDAMSTKENDLPMKILRFFRRWTKFFSSTKASTGDDACSEDEAANGVPALVEQDVDEILSTCALCLGNISACNLPMWDDSDGLELFWRELVSMLATPSGVEAPESSTHAISVMLSMLRSQPRSRTLVNESILDALFAILSQLPKADGDNTGSAVEALVRSHCHVVSIFGVLCSEPHDASVDARICSSLLGRLRSASSDSTMDDRDHEATRHSVLVTHEILNVLMDVYGGDDCYDDVFEKENVLDHFRRCLPGFKRRIKKVAIAGRISGDSGRRREVEEEVCVWNETALNASRFIKYKSNGE